MRSAIKVGKKDQPQTQSKGETSFRSSSMASHCEEQESSLRQRRRRFSDRCSWPLHVDLGTNADKLSGARQHCQNKPRACVRPIYNHDSFDLVSSGMCRSRRAFRSTTEWKRPERLSRRRTMPKIRVRRSRPVKRTNTPLVLHLVIIWMCALMRAGASAHTTNQPIQSDDDIKGRDRRRPNRNKTSFDGLGTADSFSDRPTAALRNEAIPGLRTRRTSDAIIDDADSSNRTSNKTALHMSHCEKQALMYNETIVASDMVPATRSDPNFSGVVAGLDIGRTQASNTPVAVCTNGFARDEANDIIYPCSNVDLLSFIPLTTMHEAVNVRPADYGIGQDVWGWTDQESGREFALMNFEYGLACVEVTNPTSPTYLGVVPSTRNRGNKWHDVKVKNNHAYVVSEDTSHGLQIISLKKLLNYPAQSNYQRVIDADKTIVPYETNYDENLTTDPDWFGKAHNLVVNEDPRSNLLIAVGSDRCDGGLFVMDLDDPLNPVFMACYGDDGYVHDAHCVTYKGPAVRFTGREICFCFNEDTVTVVDMDNRVTSSQPNYYDANYMKILSKFYHPNGDWYYVHQGSLTEDQTYLLVDDEGDEGFRQARGGNGRTATYVLDVSELENIKYVGVYYSSQLATDHNHYVKGQYNYQANYNAGLRVLNLANIQNPPSLVEVAYFDVDPNRNTNEMVGAWSTYPFFSSGTIIVSSTERGLYILRARLLDESTLAQGCSRSSSSNCVSRLYSDDFGMQKQNSKFKRIRTPVLPEGGTGKFVGRLSIGRNKKRSRALEVVNIPVASYRSVKVFTRVGLRNGLTNGLQIKLVVKVRCSNGSTSPPGRTQTLSSESDWTYDFFIDNIPLPSGCSSINAIEFRAVKSLRIASRIVLLFDSVEVDGLGSPEIYTTASARYVDNVFRSVADRQDNLRE